MLTNEEFGKLENYRINFQRQSDAARKKPAQLALEHLEALSEQQARLIQMAESIIAQHRKSICYRTPRFFALQAARVKHLWTRLFK
jgi:hypothetical protein